MTNYHKIIEEYLNENKEITILLNDEKEALIIDLTIEREKYFSKEYDITALEIKENDKVKEYLEIDDKILKDNEEVNYEKKSIYIALFKRKKYMCFIWYIK